MNGYGRIVSSVLWDIRDRFDNDVTISDVNGQDADRLAAYALTFNPHTLLDLRDSYELADTYLYSGSHLNIISQTFEGHGIYLQNFPQVVDGIIWIDTNINTGITLSSNIVEMNLPFSFPYYGQNFTKIFISGNGYVTFSNPEVIKMVSENIPSTNLPNGIIAPYARSDNYYNLFPGVSYLSTVDKFVVTWHFGSFNYASDYEDEPSLIYKKYFKFQVILEPNGKIRFQYYKLFLDTQAFIGIENHDGSKGVFFPTRQVYDNTQLVFENYSD